MDMYTVNESHFDNSREVCNDREVWTSNPNKARQPADIRNRSEGNYTVLAIALGDENEIWITWTDAIWIQFYKRILTSYHDKLRLEW
jgi:hypothetical protein